MPARVRVLLIGVLLATGLTRGGVAQTIPVRLGGEASSLLGVPLSVPIEVDLTGRPDVKLGSFALVVRWNPAVLRFDRGQNGTFGDVFANQDSLPLGVARLVGANPAGAVGTVVLGIAHLTPIADAVDTFRFQVTELYAAGTFADLLPSATWADRAYCTARGRFGDLNSNQGTNGQDALLVLSHAVGIDISAQGLPLLGDVDGDGATAARDALIILSAAVGLDVSAFRVLRIAPGPCGDARRPSFLVTPAQVTMDLGQAARLTAVARDSLGNGVAATDVGWKSSDTVIARVSATGVVTAVGPGNAAITATRLGASSATATVAVSDRRVHWVDAFAFVADSDQIGAPELPFRTLQQAVSYAQPGDTIKVRAGRYDDRISVVKPLVVMGDTAGGRPRPIIAASGPYTTGISINTTGRVELRNLQLDTLYQAVSVTFVDTLLVRDVQFRSPSAAYYGALYVDSAGAVLVQRSGFFGKRTGTYYYANSAIWAYNVGVVSIDSTIISDYGDDGVYLNRVDSLFVRHSVIRHNYGYGIYACTDCFAAGPGIAVVFTGNRLVQNDYGHMWLDQLRSARFDHNVMVGGGYDALNLYGDTASTLVTFLSDSVTVRAGGGGWINLYDFDSLSVDSLIVQQRGYSYPYIRGGRILSVRNSRFLDLEGYALTVDAFPRDTTRLVLRQVEFLGPDSAVCDRCGYAVDGYQMVLDADSVRAANLYRAVYADYSRIDLRHATLEHMFYGVQVSCGVVNLTSDSLVGGTYGVLLYGCTAASDSLVVSNSIIRDHSSYGVLTSNATTLVSSSVFSNNYYGLDQACRPLRITNATFTGGWRAIDGYGCASTDSAIINQTSVSAYDYGVYLTTMPTRLTNSTFTDINVLDAQVYSGWLHAADNQFVRSRGSYALYGYRNNAGQSARLERNSVTCAGPLTEGLYLDHYGAANPDSAWVLDNTVSGCDGGINVYGNASRVEIRNNTVSMPPAGEDGIVGQADTLVRIVGNTVTGPAEYGSIVLYNARRADVDTNTVTGGVQAAIYHWSGYPVDTLHIRDNTISNHGIASCCLSRGAIVLDASASANVEAHVLRNRITDSRSNGIVLLRDFGDTVTVQVDSNTVKRADSVGIWVRFYSKANIRKNATDSVGLDAVRLEQYSGVVPALVNNNNFSRSVRKAVNNVGSAGTIDATNNYWSSALGPRCATGCDPSGGDSVSANVTFSPFLASAQPDAPVPAPPPVVAPVVLARGAAPVVASAPMGTSGAVRRWTPEQTAVGVVRPAPALQLQPALPRAPLPAAFEPPQRVLAADRLQTGRRESRFAEKLRRLEELAALRAEREQELAERRAAREATRAEPVKRGPR